MHAACPLCHALWIPSPCLPMPLSGPCSPRPGFFSSPSSSCTSAGVHHQPLPLLLDSPPRARCGLQHFLGNNSNKQPWTYHDRCRADSQDGSLCVRGPYSLFPVENDSLTFHHAVATLATARWKYSLLSSTALEPLVQICAQPVGHTCPSTSPDGISLVPMALICGHFVCEAAASSSQRKGLLSSLDDVASYHLFLCPSLPSSCGCVCVVTSYPRSRTGAPSRT